MNILVTGGAGYMGSTLIEKLLMEGHAVVSVDNLSRGNYIRAHFEKNNFCRFIDLIVGDICDSSLLETVMKRHGGIDAIVHLAAIPGLARCRNTPDIAIKTNIYGTYNVLETARKLGVDRVIFPSCGAVYGNPVKTPMSEDHPLVPMNIYGLTKLAGERLLETFHRSYGLCTTALRIGNTYGVGVYTYWENVIPKFVRLALKGQPLVIYGDGNQSRDFLHIRDVVKAIILTLKAEKEQVAGEAINIGSGKATSVNTVADIISRVFDKNYEKTIETTHTDPLWGEAYNRFCFSTAKSIDKLGFLPEWSIEQGVTQLIEYGGNRDD